MSRFIESSPCRAQARLMKKLGFTSLDTDDTMTAIWQQGFMTLSFPASWQPKDEAEILCRVATLTFEQGREEARREIRQSLGLK